jgi:hypothetical protein
MDDLKCFQLIVSRIDAHTEVKACIPEYGALLTGMEYYAVVLQWFISDTNNQNIRCITRIP